MRRKPDHAFSDNPYQRSSRTPSASSMQSSDSSVGLAEYAFAMDEDFENNTDQLGNVSTNNEESNEVLNNQESNRTVNNPSAQNISSPKNQDLPSTR